MLSQAVTEEDFARFVSDVEPKLSRALVAAYGPEVGRESARDALVYAWENWNRIAAMDNPVGYLYRVGQGRDMYAFGIVELSAFDFIEVAVIDENGRIIERHFPSIGP